MSREKISLCMIVRDEENVLRLCLDSVVGLVDEMIIVDTGSTDKTVEIAAEFGASIYDFEWINDFSQARNFSIEQANSEWILILDADEVLERNDHARIRALIANEESSMYSLIQTTYGDESATFGWIPNTLQSTEAQGYPGYIESPLVRLFRNKPEIKFHGIIHEHACHEDGSLEPYASPVRIHHYGKYVDVARDEKKNELYLKLGVRKCDLQPTDAHAFYELGVQYWSMDKAEAARRVLRKAEVLDPDYVSPKVALAAIDTSEGNFPAAIKRYARIMQIDSKNELPYLYLPALLIEIKNYALAEHVLNIGSQVASTHPSFHINRGVVKRALGNYRGAITCFNKALELNQKEPLALLNLGMVHMDLEQWSDSYRNLVEAEKSPRIKNMALKKRAEWCFRQGKFSKARELIMRVIGDDVEDKEAHYQLSVIYIKEGSLDRARDCLRKIDNYEGFDQLELERLHQCYLAAGDAEMAQQVSLHQEQAVNLSS